MEQSYGSFQRVLALSEDSDEGSVGANMKNGALGINVTRNALPESQIKRIPIH